MRYSALGVWEEDMQPLADSYECKDRGDALETAKENAPDGVTLLFILDGEPEGQSVDTSSNQFNPEEPV